MNVPLKEEHACTNDEGDAVSAYMEYSEEYDEYFAPFTKIQAIRLLRRRVGEDVNVKQMKQQGVVTNFFIKGSYTESKVLADNLCSFPRMLCLPDNNEAQVVRDYFGEKLGLWSLWVSKTLRGLFLCAVLGLSISIVRVYVKISGK